ncbi:Hypothetical predicted protein [Pelobates cultripes]|uniref:Uncharacterized protein n=1 Tax=Pelobates cultripes TaxID=61616 RepID=A0AAD1QXR3_PELCU|nr:Hypothetical predicted protein [Pelobates cultripes]
MTLTNTEGKAHKVVIRGQLISRASFLNRTTQKLHLTPYKLRDLNTAQFLHPNTALSIEIEQITNQLNDLLLQQIALTPQTLKLRHYTQENRAGKKLASLLRHQQTQSKIQYLITNTGRKIYSPLDINAETAAYYQDLYNLKDDPQTNQPTQDEIRKFLSQIHL